VVRFAFTPIDSETVKAIAEWRYDPPYSLYDTDATQIDSFLRPDYRYFGIVNEDAELIGYCNFGADARVAGYEYPDDALDVGVGMRPDLVGRGLGLQFSRSVLNFARRTYAPEALRATIAMFNRRTRRLCLALGFREVARFERASEDDEGMEFVVMRLDL
jgi:[ribosomal protein S18]-alanine N-acetyltransferase